MMTMSQLGRELRVSRGQVWAWQHRRGNNGFPLPKRKDAAGRDLYDLAEVKRWRLNYRPSLGGAPRKSPAGTC